MVGVIAQRFLLNYIGKDDGAGNVVVPFNEGARVLRPYSRITRQAEQEALWRLKERSFSQVKKDTGICYSTLRCLLEREMDDGALGCIDSEAEIFLGIDVHSFKHQELVHIVTEVKKCRVLGILMLPVILK